MKKEFWRKAWKEGNIGFHKKDYHQKLLEFFPKLKVTKGDIVLVPFCGKSKDMLWLNEQGFIVIGVELEELAVIAFFKENNLDFKVSYSKGFKIFESANIKIYCGDFFAFLDKEKFDVIYDRAAFVALPQSMRANYATSILRNLKNGGRYFLICFEYDQSKLDGPPFSISKEEIDELFGENLEIKHLDTHSLKTESTKFNVLDKFEEKTYLLSKP